MAALSLWAVLFAACGLVWPIGQVATILFDPHY